LHKPEGLRQWLVSAREGKGADVAEAHRLVSAVIEADRAADRLTLLKGGKEAEQFCSYVNQVHEWARRVFDSVEGEVRPSSDHLLVIGKTWLSDR